MDRNSIFSFCMMELAFSLPNILKVISPWKKRGCDCLYATEFCSHFVDNLERRKIGHESLVKRVFKNWISRPSFLDR